MSYYPYAPAKYVYTDTYRRIQTVRTESRDWADLCGGAPAAPWVCGWLGRIEVGLNPIHCAA